MVWHILKKDLRLLWIPALAVGMTHFASVALRCRLGVFQEPNQLLVVADLLSIVSLIGIVAMTVAVMHQDAVPGVRQDWLIRPIKRGDLILAKLLFVILVVQAPLLGADLIGALIEGFGLAASITAAAARNLEVLCYFSLPAMMVGAVTRNLMESFFFVLMGVLTYAAVFLVGMVMLLGIRTSVGGTGLSWMVAATWYALALGGTAVVLSLQFFRRRTTLARALIGVGGAAIILSSFLPWRAAFALQQRFSQEPDAADAIALKFNPLLGRFKRPPGAAAATSTALYLPLQVTGVPSATIMVLDRANVRIADHNGRILYEGRSNLSVDGVGSIQDARLEVQQSSGSHAPADVYQRIFIPAGVYGRLGTQPVNMEIEYSLTLFRAKTITSIPATNAQERLRQLGWCATRVYGEGDDVQIRCLHTAREPSCFTAFLEVPASGLRNPAKHACEPDYTPIEGTFWPDAISRFGGEIPFFDRSGLIRYPVDGTQLANARVILETYVPRAHFTRHLNINDIRLSEITGPLAASRPPR